MQARLVCRSNGKGMEYIGVLTQRKGEKMKRCLDVI